MSTSAACPVPRPQPVWRRALLWIGAVAWWSLCMAQSYCRQINVAVRGRLHRRPLTRNGWPTSRHPDLGVGLPAPVRQWLAEVDTEVTAGLPIGLRVALTCGLRGLAPGFAGGPG